MREVCIVGIGQTPIGELWEYSLRDLAFEALKAALDDAGLEGEVLPEALFVGNMMASHLSRQAHLGTLIADYCGWHGIEATTIEAACASGGAAFRAGYLAVASGMVDVAAVCGVEKMTDAGSGETTAALATAADADYESAHGATFVALNALMMRRYMYEFQIPHEAFAPFSMIAHHNAIHNPNAMYHYEVTLEKYKKAPVVAPPLNLYDSSPICDGAAAAILCPLEMARGLAARGLAVQGLAARDLAKANPVKPVKILASISATDFISLHSRKSITELLAGRISAYRAYEMARIKPADVDIFEVHDAFSIIAALSLESAGFAERGKAAYQARDGEFSLNGRLPISTLGGLKARGHPVGATGVYEIADVVTQLRGQAGKNQVSDAKIGMTQNIGGTGATVVTHILSSDI